MWGYKERGANVHAEDKTPRISNRYTVNLHGSPPPHYISERQLNILISRRRTVWKHASCFQGLPTSQQPETARCRRLTWQSTLTMPTSRYTHS